MCLVVYFHTPIFNKNLGSSLNINSHLMNVFLSIDKIKQIITHNVCILSNVFLVSSQGNTMSSLVGYNY